VAPQYPKVFGLLREVINVAFIQYVNKESLLLLGLSLALNKETADNKTVYENELIDFYKETILSEKIAKDGIEVNVKIQGKEGKL
jgi:hypothetical protein